MILVYRSHDPVEFGLVREVLEQHRIPLLVRNQFLAGGAGELPLTECWPELWVLDEADDSRARRLVAETLGPAEPAADWICPHCGESAEGQFARCWHCGCERPSDLAGADR